MLERKPRRQGGTAPFCKVVFSPYREQTPYREQNPFCRRKNNTIRGGTAPIRQRWCYPPILQVAQLHFTKGGTAPFRQGAQPHFARVVFSPYREQTPYSLKVVLSPIERKTPILQVAQPRFAKGGVIPLSRANPHFARGFLLQRNPYSLGVVFLF